MAVVAEELRRQGLWFEADRKRWRVKLFKEGELFCRAYFPEDEYETALNYWREQKRAISQPDPNLPLREASLFNRFLCSSRIT